MSSAPKSILDHHLPVDVVEEIILKLPVKDILRCKSLSKSYYALTENPRFIDRYSRHHCSKSNIISVVKYSFYRRSDDSNNKIVCLLPSPHKGPYFTPHHSLDTSGCEGYNMQIIGSCNGLLCAQLGLWPKPGHIFLVWNPATREELVIPPLHPFMNISYDRKSDVIGFGYDATSNDYKLVFISSRRSSRTLNLWSLKANTWREKEHDLGETILISQGLFVRGNLYWLTMKQQWRSTLASFRTVDDTFCTDIKLPPYDDNVVCVEMSITDHMGSLALFICYGNSADTGNYVVWVMDNYETYSWNKKYSIGTFGRLIGMINSGDKLLMRDRDCVKYFLYDPDKKEKNYLSEDDGRLLHREVSVDPPWTFSESLVSLKSNDDDSMARKRTC